MLSKKGYMGGPADIWSLGQCLPAACLHSRPPWQRSLAAGPFVGTTLAQQQAIISCTHAG